MCRTWTSNNQINLTKCMHTQTHTYCNSCCTLLFFCGSVVIFYVQIVILLLFFFFFFISFSYSKNNKEEKKRQQSEKKTGEQPRRRIYYIYSYCVCDPAHLCVYGRLCVCVFVCLWLWLQFPCCWNIQYIWYWKKLASFVVCIIESYSSYLTIFKNIVVRDTHERARFGLFLPWSRSCNAHVAIVSSATDDSAKRSEPNNIVITCSPLRRKRDDDDIHRIYSQAQPEQYHTI